MATKKENQWEIFKGKPEEAGKVAEWPEPPPWRFTPEDANAKTSRGSTYRSGPEEIQAVNAAIHLRRPLLVTGKPGVGKSSLAYAIAHELQLGPVLTWPISTKSTLQEGLYGYDAIGRLQAIQALEGDDIGRFIRLGPLGTALLGRGDHPRVVLIDEIDKSDVDLPNDLLNVLEEGVFKIEELARLESDKAIKVRTAGDEEPVEIVKGQVRCKASSFPIVVLTSNGEREFPAPFLRRCIRLRVQEPKEPQLNKIIDAHFTATGDERESLVIEFLAKQKSSDMSTDQLMNAVFLLAGKLAIDDEARKLVRDLVYKALSGPEAV